MNRAILLTLMLSCLAAGQTTIRGPLTITDSATRPPLGLTARSAAPTTPATGEIYLDDGTNTSSGKLGFRRYTGAAWVDLGQGYDADLATWAAITPHASWRDILDGTTTTASNNATIRSQVSVQKQHMIDVTEAPYNAVGDGSTDDTAAIQAAIDAAYASGAGSEGVYFPYGLYKVTSTINVTCPLIGDGRAPQIRCYITDGTACFKWDNFDRFHAENLRITSSDNSAIGNFIGMQAINSCSRGHMKNVEIRKAAKCMEWDGWINNWYNMQFLFSTEGASFTSASGCFLNFNAESITGVAIDFQGSSTIMIGCSESNGTGCKINSSSAVYANIEMESNTDYDYLVGNDSACYSITLAGSVASYAGSLIDNVCGLACHELNLSSNTPITFGPNVRMKDGGWPNRLGAAGSGYIGYQEITGSTGETQSKAYNWTPNPMATTALRGYTAVAPTRLTLTTVGATDPNMSRGGLMTTKSGAASTGAYVRMDLPSAVATHFAGRTARVGVWCYIPDDANFPDDGYDCYPHAGFQYSADGVTYTGTSAGTPTWKNGQWNLFAADVNVASTAAYTRWSLHLYGDDGNNVPDTAYVIWSGFFVTDVFADWSDCSTGKLPIHPSIGRYTGDGCWEWPGTSGTLSDADQSYVIGDTVVNSDPDSGEAERWVCTTAGAGGAAVFAQAGIVGGIASPVVLFNKTIESPSAASDNIRVKVPWACTITQVSMKCEGGTNVIGRLYECDSDGVDGDEAGIEAADWTVTTSATDDTSFANASLDAGDWLDWKTTSVAGAVTQFNITVWGTVP